MLAVEATSNKAALEGIDKYVEEAMARWRVPGLGLAVIADGAIVLARGYGLRDVARGLPATADTIFAIGSCTKAFTTMAMGMLVEGGTLDWDAPVRSYLPDFAMHDPIATELMTPRDLVTHRSGLPRHDAVWYKSPLSRAGLLARLRHLPPSKTFRQAMQYQNLMYMTAGYLSGKVAGMEWEDLVRTRILAPLGMRRSNLSVWDSQRDEDFAQPYREANDEVIQIPFGDYPACGPAGMINSSVREMCAWLLLQLNKGVHGETRLISEAQLAQMHAPQMAIPEAGKPPEMPYASYALGWMVQPYRGQPALWHTGGIDGFLSRVTLLPEQRAGIVVLTNLGSGALVNELTYHLCDRLLDLDQLPWHERVTKEYQEARAAQESAKSQAASERVPDTNPSHPLDAYTGEYSHKGYGTVAVSQENDQLVAVYNGMTLPLTHYHYDTFETEMPSPWEMRVTALFAANTEGEIESVAIPFEPAVPAIVFTRLPDARLRERAYLEPFTGEYEIMGKILTVALQGEDTLAATMPGQPVFMLEPIRRNTFRVKDLPLRLRFTLDREGAADGVTLIQPGAALSGKRR